MKSDVQGLNDVEPDLEDHLWIHDALCHARALVDAIRSAQAPLHSRWLLMMKVGPVNSSSPVLLA